MNTPPSVTSFFLKIMALARPYRGRLILGVLFGVLAGLTNPLLMVSVKLAIEASFPDRAAIPVAERFAQAPEFVQRWFEQAQGNFEASSNDLFKIALIALIPLSMLLRGGFTYLNTYLMSWVSVRVVADLRQRLFDHLMAMSVGYFNKVSTGTLMTHMSAAAAVQGVISNSLATIIRDPVTIISLIAFLFWQQPRLTVGALLILPLTLVPFIIYARKWRRFSRASYETLVEQGKQLHESLSGHRIIKAYNLEQKALNEFAASTREYVGFNMRLVRATELPSPMMEFAGALAVAIFLGYAIFAGRGMLSGGDMLQFIGSIFLLYQPVKALLRLRHQVITAQATTEGIFHALEVRSEIPEPAQPKPLQAAGADVRFENLSFKYEEKPVLENVSFTARANKLTALVGPSGSGKTTLTNLLLRFYDPTSGRLTIGGLDLRDVSTTDLRNQISIVTQETFLFNDTIRNNIAAGKPGATMAEIEAVARAAQAHDFIVGRPQGYDTVIGERGISLSGGQRQRLAIARALLKNAPILILDEATSSLDTESERAIQAALDKLMEGRTTFCIAHRLSTVLNADLIVCLDHGRVAEMGTHSELLAAKGLYARLYQIQFGA